MADFPFKPLEVLRRPFFLPLLLLICVILILDRRHETTAPNYPTGNAIYKGVLTKLPHRSEGKTYLTVDLAKELKPQDTPMSGRIKLTVLQDRPDLKKGDQILFETILKKPQSYHNPGSFDYAAYLRREGISAVGFLDDPSMLTFLDESTASGWQKKSDRLKTQMDLAFKQQGTPESASLLKALLWGDENDLSADTEKLFRDQGLSHLLVISGLHFTVLAGVLFFLVLCAGKIYPPLFLHLPMRKIAAGATILGLTVYFNFCEPGASITRAYLAVVCFLIGLLFDRPRDILNLFFLSAFIILLVQPHDLFSLSFQYSFVAVATLIFILPWLKKIPMPWKGKIWTLFLVNVALLIGLTPLITMSFPQIPPNSFIMNLWAVPFLEGVVTPIGLISMALFPLMPSLGLWGFKGDLLLTQSTLWILQKAALYLPHPFWVYPPHFYELLVYYMLLIVLILGFRKRTKQIALGLGVIFFAVDISYWIYHRHFESSFEVTQIDVGQGDALLVQTPGSHFYLVDGGGSPYFDVGENVLIPYLLYRRVPKLDAVVATHADTDHYLGLQTVVKSYPFNEFWWNGVATKDVEFNHLLETVREKKVIQKVLKEGDHFSRDTASFTVFNPPLELEADAVDNNTSLAFIVTAKDRKAFLTGDIEWPVEYRLVEKYGGALKADYLKVPHHGSRSSSSELFLKTVAPSVATYGARLGNRFGHPHVEVVKRYQQLGIILKGTDREGAISVDLFHLQPSETKN